MKKLCYLLIIVFTSLLITSCSTSRPCAAYGDMSKYQTKTNYSKFNGF